MSGLQFQDFGLGGADSPFTANPNNDPRETTRDTANLVDGTATEANTPNKHHFLSFKFYQQYFDVDTEQVYTRILNSALPRSGCNFIRDQLQPFPDLYGPFWICVTLVFSAAIFGNFAHYIETLGSDLYENDFKLVTGISTIIGCYVIFVPLLIYITLYYRNSIQYSYIELVALYGYSLAALIPVSVLWVVHYNWFRWSLLLVAISLSGYVLASTINDAIKTDPNKLVALGLVAGVILLHTGLAVGIKEYYFDTILPVKNEPAHLPPAALTSAPLPNPTTHGAPVPKAAALLQNDSAKPGAAENPPPKAADKKEEETAKEPTKEDTKEQEKPPAEPKDKPDAEAKPNDSGGAKKQQPAEKPSEDAKKEEPEKKDEQKP